MASHHRGQMGVLIGDGLMPVHPTPSRDMGVPLSTISAIMNMSALKIGNTTPEAMPLCRARPSRISETWHGGLAARSTVCQEDSASR
jgi:hypothetical protein